VINHLSRSLATIIIKGKRCPSVTKVTLFLSVISIETFTRPLPGHLRLYCGVDVTMVANELNKFGQIFPIYRRRKYNDGNFHSFDFTPKSHLRKIILCQGYTTFFPNLFQNHPV
jgi:hypothetical protein